MKSPLVTSIKAITGPKPVISLAVQPGPTPDYLKAVVAGDAGNVYTFYELLEPVQQIR